VDRFFVVSNRKGVPMSIFGRIMDKIFGRDEQKPAARPAPASASASPATLAAKPTPPPVGTAVPAPAQTVDVEKVLSEMAARNPQKLNWRESIVDLLKLLDLDSNLQARRELAGELGYRAILTIPQR
jgi:hypothetical protein